MRDSYIFRILRDKINDKSLLHNVELKVSLFVCLFGVFCLTWGNFFHSFGDVNIVGEGLQFLPMLGTYGHWAWGFFSVSHLLWHGPSVYNGHLRGPVTPTPNAERLAVELSLPVLTQPSASGANALINCTTAAAKLKVNEPSYIMNQHEGENDIPQASIFENMPH